MITICGKNGEPIYSAKFDESFIETLDSDARKDLVKTVMDAMVEREKCIQEARVKIASQHTEANANAFRQFTGELTRLITSVAGPTIDTNVIDVSPTNE